MGLKFVIQPDHIPVNNYICLVAGLPPITFVSIGALEKELDCVELPDRTQASTGRTKPGETEVKVPLHHTVEIAVMNAWYIEGQEPVSPFYKKAAVLTGYSGTTFNRYNTTIIGFFTYKEGLPDWEMNDDGEMAVMTYTMKWDDWF